jgi:predicted amidohydrolase YtcJ
MFYRFRYKYAGGIDMIKMMSLKPDVIYFNGEIHTVNCENSIEQAVALNKNYILAVGNNDEILALADKDTFLYDLKGRALIPGIIDSHNHAWEAGLLMDGIIVFGISSIEELKKRISERLKTMSPTEWLQGGSWIETQFVENRMPNKWDLDEVSPNNPVVLERIFGTCVVNSLALKLAGITKDTPNPEGGEIERDPETGEPNGILHRSAILMVRKIMPGPFGSDAFGASQGDPSIEVLEMSIKTAMNEYVKYGITGVVEPGVSPAICRAYQNLRNKDLLKFRVGLMPNWYGFTLKQEMDKMGRLIDDFGIYSGFGDGWLRLIGLKMAIDGGLTSKTALKSWPYLGEETPRKVSLRLDLSKLKGWVKQAHNAGWNVAIHVMGDIAIEEAVNAIYEAYKEKPVKLRHQIVHAYYPTEDSLKKMKEAGILVSVQPSFTYGEADGYDELLPKDKQESFLPMKTYLESGIVEAISTDMPCAHVNPFWGLYSAVTRKGMRGYQLGTKECVTITEALRMMTINGAYMTGEEEIKGSIEPGKLADMVVLDRGLIGLCDEDIKNISVDRTILNGKVVYNKEI